MNPSPAWMSKHGHLCNYLFKELARNFNITSIFVTHDLKEALLMGDRIAYMDKGSLTTYSRVDDFVNDPSIGVQDEIAFWTGLTRFQRGGDK